MLTCLPLCMLRKDCSEVRGRSIFLTMPINVRIFLLASSFSVGSDERPPQSATCRLVWRRAAYGATQCRRCRDRRALAPRHYVAMMTAALAISCLDPTHGSTSAHWVYHCQQERSFSGSVLIRKTRFRALASPIGEDLTKRASVLSSCRQKLWLCPFQACTKSDKPSSSFRCFAYAQNTIVDTTYQSLSQGVSVSCVPLWCWFQPR